MAKAQLTTKLGTKVTIEGTSDEVADLLARVEGEAPPSMARASVQYDAKPFTSQKSYS